MSLLRKRRAKHIPGLADLVDYQALIDDGIVLLSTGAYVACWVFRGPDMDALPPAECWHLANRLANKFRLGTGWTIQCDLIRSEHQEYAQESQHWPDPISYMIDQERRSRFTMEGEAAMRLSEYFFSLSYEPPMRGGKKAANLVFSPTELGREGAGERSLAQFTKRVAEIDSLLRANLSHVRRLKGYQGRVGSADQLFDESCQFIRRCISGENYPFAVSECPNRLNEYLAPDDLTGGAEPELGDPLNALVPGKNIALLAIDGFPEKSFAGILRELDSIPFDFRCCLQAQLMDEQEARDEHAANSNRWKFKKDPKALNPVRSGTVKHDNFSAKMELDADIARSNAEHGKEIFVRFSAKVIVMESDLFRLKEAVDAIVRTVKYRCGFSCRIETINAVAAYLATFPGHMSREKRRFIVNTENLVHMMPLSSPFRGHAYNPSAFFPIKSPPLFYAVTSGGTPYRFHSHVSDVGHALIQGPTGAGKTTLVALAMAQWFRYPNAQVFAFDKKRTYYTLCQAMGGDFYELNPDSRERLCPLRELSTANDRAWAARFMELLCTLVDLRLTPTMRNEIKETVEDLAASDAAGRSIADFQMAVPSRDIKDALQFYVGTILDGTTDRIGMSRFVVFEMNDLYQLSKPLTTGALFALFRKIQRRLDPGRPTFIPVDEFRESLSHETAAKFFEDTLLEGRKLNCAVWFVLQEMTKALVSPLRSVILNSCHRKIFLPNPQAIGEEAGVYETLGMNAVDRELIAHAIPKEQYYDTSPDGRRMISLELQDVALSFIANSSDKDRTLVDSLREHHGEQWPAWWLRARGLEEWGNYFEGIAAKREAAYA